MQLQTDVVDSKKKCVEFEQVLPVDALCPCFRSIFHFVDHNRCLPVVICTVFLLFMVVFLSMFCIYFDSIYQIFVMPELITLALEYRKKKQTEIQMYLLKCNEFLYL